MEVETPPQNPPPQQIESLINRKSDQENLSLKEDQIEYVSNWVWRATAQLLDLPDFSPSAKWIAKRLNISIAQGVEALEGLERLKIIKRTASGYEKSQANIFGNGEKLPQERLVPAHVLVTTQINSRLNKYSRNSYRTAFIATNLKNIKSFLNYLDKAFDFLLKESNQERESNESVYAINFSLADLGSAAKEEEQG